MQANPFLEEMKKKIHKVLQRLVRCDASEKFVIHLSNRNSERVYSSLECVVFSVFENESLLLLSLSQK